MPYATFLFTESLPKTYHLPKISNNRIRNQIFCRLTANKNLRTSIILPLFSAFSISNKLFNLLLPQSNSLLQSDIKFLILLLIRKTGLLKIGLFLSVGNSCQKSTVTKWIRTRNFLCDLRNFQSWQHCLRHFYLNIHY